MKLGNKKTGKIINAFFVLHEDGNPKQLSFGTIKEIVDNYEDYKPKEPLIKDEKIRKAVRAWADVMEIETVEFDEYWQSFRRDNSTICFKDLDGYLYLEDGENYTIAELCGEENK